METILKSGIEYPPAWAGGWGEDLFGAFADLIYNSETFRLRWIPPGSFQMGSPEDEAGRIDREGPRHSVVISQGFWLGETPCTQGQWEAVMEGNPSDRKSRDFPVENITWNDCVEFCLKMTNMAGIQNALVGEESFRLPTEAEWEYACRAGTESAFHDGSACTEPKGKDPALDRLGWFDENSGNETHKVKGKAPNDWGLYDLHGNVWEWCLDGLREYEERPERDPLGSTEESALRVLRGGSWISGAGSCRSALRRSIIPDDRGIHVGFRLAAGQPPRSGSLITSGASSGRSEG